MIYTDITQLLEANTIGSFGADLFWGNMPHEPDELLVFYDSPGPMSTYAKDGRAQEEGRLQVLSRAPDTDDTSGYETAMSRALEVYDLFDNYRSPIYSIRALQRPFDVGAQDEAGRTIISTNYALRIYPT
jgi:hypothetical protein